jgi:tetratricopeptide (TPR) repeat protein
MPKKWGIATLLWTLLLVPGSFLDLALGFQESSRADSYYHYSLAKLYAEDRNVSAAIAEFEKAVALDSQSARLRYEYANTLYELADHLRDSTALSRAIQEARKSLELDPDDLEVHLLLGKIYTLSYRRGQSDMLEAAVTEWKKVLELDPDQAEALYSLGSYYYERKDFVEAAEQFHRFNQVRIGIPEGYSSEARALVGAGRIDEALAVLETSLGYRNDDADTLALLGRLYEDTGRDAEALEAYQHFLTLVPAPEIQARTGALLSRLGRFSEAVPLFRELISQDPKNATIKVELGKALEGSRKFREAAEILSAVVEEDESHQEANYYLASCYRALGQREEAIERVRHLIAATERDTLRTPYRSRFKSFLAILLQESRQFDAAVETFREVCREDPNDSRARLGLVYALEDAGEVQEALTLSRELLQELPSDLDRNDVVITHARVLAVAGQLDEAIALLKAEIERTGQEDFYLAAGQIYLERKKFAEAEKIVQDGLEHKPDSEQMHFQLAAVLERQGKFEDAELKFKEILSSNPTQGAALNYLGYMLAERGERLEEARDYVLRALQQDPHNGAYLDSLGWVYFKLDQLELAETNLVQASQVNDADPTIFEHLGDLYLKLGDHEKARIHYQKSAFFAEDAEERQKVEKKLASLDKLTTENNPN